jgi:hypothetical protein
MPQQNKTTDVDGRRKALEASLMSETANANIGGIETGRRIIHENSNFQRKATRDAKALRITQGLRYRHPDRVLHQFKGVTSTSSESASLWEKSLIDQTKRVEMPKEYSVSGDAGGMVNQMGIVSVALDNYKASKNKFSRLHLVNV